MAARLEGEGNEERAKNAHLRANLDSFISEVNGLKREFEDARAREEAARAEEVRRRAAELAGRKELARSLVSDKKWPFFFLYNPF
jgi:t-SNARE complex subunit (syntaxin)